MKKKTNELIDVHDPDLLVIGRRQPVVQARSGKRWRRASAWSSPSIAPYWTVKVPVIVGWTVQTNV